MPILSCSSQKYLNILNTKLKSAIRFISNSKYLYNYHTEFLFKIFSILPLDKLITFFYLQIMQRNKQGLMPISFNDTWLSNADRRNEEHHPQK